MCRLFGFRSTIQSQVHSSLVSADNALAVQSNQHPDGWGVAYYLGGAPHIVKANSTAINCNIFKKVSGVVSSQTVLAHLRKATQGENSILNTHPFQYGQWVFVHNGNIKNFDKHRQNIANRISPHFKRFILGQTDSELLFYFILSHLDKKIDLLQKDNPFQKTAIAVKESIAELKKEIGEFSMTDDCGPDETYLTFVITNGKTMLAHQGGKNLFYSTHKKECPEKENCPSFDQSCENLSETGYVNHLIFSSEPLQGQNVWIPLERGQVVGVDAHMKLEIL